MPFFRVSVLRSPACGGRWSKARKDWLKDPALRSLAGGVYASFLIPGVMSLGAQIGGDNKLVWRAVFVIAALVGMFFTTRLLTRLRKVGATGLLLAQPLAGDRGCIAWCWSSGLFPELVAFTGLTPIQVEAFLLCLIILTGHGLAWEMMTHKPETA